MPTIDTPSGKHTKKDDLKRPDVFLSTMDKGVGALEKNRAAVTALIALLFIGALGYVVYDFMSRRSERSASEALYKVEADYMKIREGFERAKFEAANPKTDEQKKAEAANPQPPAQAASGDLQKDYGTVLPGLEKVADEYSSQAAGGQAAVLAADIYLEYKQADKALIVLDKVTTKQKSNGIMFGVTHMLRGSTHAASGDCTKAIADWTAVLGNKSSAPFHPDALLKTGVCYESLKQNDKALEAYNKVSTDFADSQAAQTAKTYLRAMETKSPAAATPKAG